MANKISFDEHKKLGKGGFGEVFRGSYDGKTKKKVAVKRVFLTNIASGDDREEELRNLDHPNVVKLYCSEVDGHFK